MRLSGDPMITLRCTHKLRKHLEISPVAQTVPPTAALGDWYANLIPTVAGDLIIFVSEKSLLTVALPVWDSTPSTPAVPSPSYQSFSGDWYLTASHSARIGSLQGDSIWQNCESECSGLDE